MSRLKDVFVLAPYTVGMVSALCLLSLWQDYLGKEDYLRRVEDNWVSSAITIPCAVFLLIWAHWSYLQTQRQETKELKKFHQTGR